MEKIKYVLLFSLVLKTQWKHCNCLTILNLSIFPVDIVCLIRYVTVQ
jgi:hypothetical protein